MPDEQPLTRTEMIALLSALQQHLNKEMQTLKQDILEDFAAKIKAAETRGREHTEQIETRVLTAFHNWASPVNHRLRKLENSDSGVLERLASVEERLTHLELRR